MGVKTAMTLNHFTLNPTFPIIFIERGVRCDAELDRTYTDSRRTFAMRVCQPGPVAFQRASVSGDNLRLITRGFPPRGVNTTLCRRSSMKPSTQ